MFICIYRRHVRHGLYCVWAGCSRLERGQSLVNRPFRCSLITPMILLTAHQTRSDFDNLLLDHARESGASVYERTRATSLRFSDQSRPVSAEWRRSYPTEHSGRISFDFLVDATGRAGLMSDRYMKNRHYNESLRNIALWGYWTGVGLYAQGTEREGAPWFEALTGKYRR